VNHLKIASLTADLLDKKFQIAGIRFGLDPIIGLVPVVGDIVPVLFSLYLIWIGYKAQVAPKILWRMAGYTLYDMLFGVIPVIGDIKDVFYKSHTINLQILKNALV